ncbi:hypothetical protein ACFOEE_00395 [Pseudoalteromonas fenneropenaei]|uniref:Uncharacterized protein n=1 Tax=Pseudoalteromonas fenneropenaei TaxID=1737459 RepID=A0ABV7CEE6_9GAMM
MKAPIAALNHPQDNRLGSPIKSKKIFASTMVLLASMSQFAVAASYQLTTQADDDGQGNTLFLDRHHVDCGNDALNALHLYRPTSTQIAYQYGCTQMPNTVSSDVYTPDNDDGGGNVIYLDRHTVNCEGKALQYLHLERPSSTTMRYHYQCGDKQLVNIKDYFTPADEDGGGNAVYLDRQNVSCPSNAVLSYARLERPTSNTIRYHYKCGTYNADAVFGFTGAFAPANWSISGVAATNMDNASLLASVNYGGGGVTAAITVAQKGVINFNWNMVVNSAGQYGDVIRYVINGVNYDLSTAGSASGVAQGINVNAGDVFQFVIWGTTQSSNYYASFSNFSFVPDPKMTPQCAFYGDNQGRNDAGFSGQTFVYHNTSYGTDRFMWNGENKGEVPIGTGSVTDTQGNVFTFGAQVSHPYADLWYYEICVNTP